MTKLDSSDGNNGIARWESRVHPASRWLARAALVLASVVLQNAQADTPPEKYCPQIVTGYVWSAQFANKSATGSAAEVCAIFDTSGSVGTLPDGGQAIVRHTLFPSADTPAYPSGPGEGECDEQDSGTDRFGDPVSTMELNAADMGAVPSQAIFPAFCPVIDRNLGDKNCPGGGGPMMHDPVNSSTGNRYEDETDYGAPGPFALSLHRYYNSYGSGVGNVGLRWGATYGRRVLPQTGTEVDLFRDTGEILYFYPCGTAWCPETDEVGTLTESVDANGVITGWQFIDANDVVEQYGPNGLLLSETSRAGVQHVLSYDSELRLSSLADSFGHTLSFSYDSSNRIQQVTEPGGGQITYAYDSAENLSTVTYPDGSTRTYLYDESAYVQSGATPSMLTGILDENNQRYATFTYNSNSQTTSSELAGGADSTQFSYGSGTTQVLDASGATRTYTYQTVLDVNHIASVSGPICTSCALAANYSYDINGNLASEIDFNGNETTYSFDTRHLEESLTQANGTAVARTTTTSWASNYRVPTLISVYAGSSASGTPNHTLSFSYDSSGNALTGSLTDTGNSPNVSRTWTYTYNSFGQVLHELSVLQLQFWVPMRAAADDHRRGG
jgi:YD repeat-containing protein